MKLAIRKPLESAEIQQKRQHIDTREGRVTLAEIVHSPNLAWMTSSAPDQLYRWKLTRDSYKFLTSVSGNDTLHCFWNYPLVEQQRLGIQYPSPSMGTHLLCLVWAAWNNGWFGLGAQRWDESLRSANLTSISSSRLSAHTSLTRNVSPSGVVPTRLPSAAVLAFIR